MVSENKPCQYCGLDSRQKQDLDACPRVNCPMKVDITLKTCPTCGKEQEAFRRKKGYIRRVLSAVNPVKLYRKLKVGIIYWKFRRRMRKIASVPCPECQRECNHYCDDHSEKQKELCMRNCEARYCPHCTVK